MSLDKNLFTLSFSPSASDPNIINLVDPQGNAHYVRRRIPGTAYEMELYDPITQSLLATASAPTTTSKSKTLTLHNPTQEVLLKSTGTLTFKWAFEWFGHEFEWKKSECYLQRKPDPPVLVAITKDTPGRLQVKTVQILDYNINRFDIEDRKGLEIVLLTALLTFQDTNETYHTPVTPPTPPPETTPAPPLPPKPEPKAGLERLKEIQACREEYNEILVESEGTIEDYGGLCADLLQDDALLFVTLRAASATEVPKVLLVVEEAKRIRHKSGLDEEEQLHQYVLYDAPKPVTKGPRRINLDDNPKPKDKYAPPQSLTVHLSKISMPELQPHGEEKKSGKKESKQVDESQKGKKKEADSKGKKKEEDTKGKKKEEEPKSKKEEKKEKKKEDKGKKTKDSPKPPVPSPPVAPPKPTPNKLTRPQPASRSDSYVVPPPPRPPNVPIIQTTYAAPPPPNFRNSFYGGQIPMPSSQPPPPQSPGGIAASVVSGLFDSLRRRSN